MISRHASLGRATIPPPGEGKRGEEGYLGYLLRQASAAYRLQLERSLADLNVTHPQFVLLTMLSAYPGASNAELARVTLLTPQSVNVIVNNLERAGAVARKPRALHGRIIELELTGKGRHLLTASRKHVLAIEQDVAKGLSPKEQRLVRQWLARIASDGGIA